MPQPASAPNPPQNSALLHQPGFASGAAAFSAAFSAGFSDSKRRGALRCAARARRARVPLAAMRLARRLSSMMVSGFCCGCARPSKEARQNCCKKEMKIKAFSATTMHHGFAAAAQFVAVCLSK